MTVQIASRHAPGTTVVLEPRKQEDTKKKLQY